MKAFVVRLLVVWNVYLHPTSCYFACFFLNHRYYETMWTQREVMHWSSFSLSIALLINVHVIKSLLQFWCSCTSFSGQCLQYTQPTHTHTYTRTHGCLTKSAGFITAGVYMYKAGNGETLGGKAVLETILTPNIFLSRSKPFKNGAQERCGTSATAINITASHTSHKRKENAGLNASQSQMTAEKQKSHRPQDHEKVHKNMQIWTLPVHNVPQKHAVMHRVLSIIRYSWIPAFNSNLKRKLEPLNLSPSETNKHYRHTT